MSKSLDSLNSFFSGLSLNSKNKDFENKLKQLQDGNIISKEMTLPLFKERFEKYKNIHGQDKTLDDFGKYYIEISKQKGKQTKKISDDANQIMSVINDEIALNKKGGKTRRKSNKSRKIKKSKKSKTRKNRK